ncbi:hypothetical protein QUD52_03640 [Lactococcus lactis]|uniref:Uncharacterized protein n=1 Tax=Lactococcus lactis TaxID=1358 RepID=A0AAW7J5E1_9LACT|nr:hypothetical protein [Lactococcus lactis]MDM7546128.1 hypothetical protein [Lactococcus lactis]
MTDTFKHYFSFVLGLILLVISVSLFTGYLQILLGSIGGISLMIGLYFLLKIKIKSFLRKVRGDE